MNAIYENGVFRPVESVEGLPERAAVLLHIEEAGRDKGRLSDFAGLWSAADADEIAAIVDAEFERIDPRDW